MEIKTRDDTILENIYWEMNRMNPDMEIKKFCSELEVSVDDVETKLREIGSNHTQRYFDAGVLSGFYFTAVSFVLKDIKSVLEIGVGCGRTVNHLSILFPSALIYTVDIPASDEDYEKFATRTLTDSNAEIFKKNIDRPNVVFIEKNSFFLSSLGLPKEFDLIWVDGNHCFPAVAWDIAFAYSHLKEDGFLFMDDYGKKDIRETIDYIKKRINETIQMLPPSRAIPQIGTIAWLKKGKAKKG